MASESVAAVHLNYIKQISKGKRLEAILRGFLPGAKGKAIVIGKKGSTIEWMRQTFNVKISIEGEKVIQTVGEPDSIAKSWTAYLKLIHETEPLSFEIGQPVSVNFLLTTSIIQYLDAIDGFRKIATDCRVEIRVHRQPLTRDCTEHIVTITVADVDDISFIRSVYALCDVLACNPRLALSYPGTEFYRPNTDDEAFLMKASSEQKEDDLVYKSV